MLILAVNIYAVTAEQVYEIASKYTSNPDTIVAICRVESSLGKHIIGDDYKSLGLMQVQVRTARWIASKDKELRWLMKLSDKSIQTVLLRDDKVSIQIACSYFEWHKKRYGYFKAISKYNGGWNNMKYINKVRKAMNGN